MAGSSTSTAELANLSDSDIEIIDVIEVKKEKQNKSKPKKIIDVVENVVLKDVVKKENEVSNQKEIIDVSEIKKEKDINSKPKEVIDIMEIKEEIDIKNEPMDNNTDSGTCQKNKTNLAVDPNFPGRIDAQCDMNPTLNKILQLSEEEDNGDEENFFECGLCLMKFVSKFSLETHAKILHKEEKTGYNCDKCKLEFTNRREYINHRNTHARKNLSSSASLQHWLTSYEKEYECNICFIKFEDLDVLASHKMSHLPQPGFRCRFCSIKIKSRQAYNNHVKNHLNSKPHHCKVCGSRFLYKAHLLNHMVFHSSKRYYQCDTCLHIFKCRADIEKHVLIHMKS